MQPFSPPKYPSPNETHSIVATTMGRLASSVQRCQIPYHDSLKPYTLPPSTFLLPRPHIRRVLSSTILFHPTSSPPLTLLLLRSPTDWNPLRWETPGGSLEPDSDPSILAAAVGELLEETSLIAKKAVCCIAVKEEVEGYGVEDDGEIWTFPEPGTDWHWAKITFFMEVEEGGVDNVILQEDEHVDYRWVTEEEVRRRQFRGEDGGKIEFVSDAVRLALLEAFRLKNEMLAAEKASGGNKGWREDAANDEDGATAAEETAREGPK